MSDLPPDPDLEPREPQTNPHEEPAPAVGPTLVDFQRARLQELWDIAARATGSDHQLPPTLVDHLASGRAAPRASDEGDGQPTLQPESETGSAIFHSASATPAQVGVILSNHLAEPRTTQELRHLTVVEMPAVFERLEAQGATALDLVPIAVTVIRPFVAAPAGRALALATANFARFLLPRSPLTGLPVALAAGELWAEAAGTQAAALILALAAMDRAKELARHGLVPDASEVVERLGSTILRCVRELKSASRWVDPSSDNGTSRLVGLTSLLVASSSSYGLPTNSATIAAMSTIESLTSVSGPDAIILARALSLGDLDLLGSYGTLRVREIRRGRALAIVSEALMREDLSQLARDLTLVERGLPSRLPEKQVFIGASSLKLALSMGPRLLEALVDHGGLLAAGALVDGAHESDEVRGTTFELVQALARLRHWLPLVDRLSGADSARLGRLRPLDESAPVEQAELDRAELLSLVDAALGDLAGPEAPLVTAGLEWSDPRRPKPVERRDLARWLGGVFRSVDAIGDQADAPRPSDDGLFREVLAAMRPVPQMLVEDWPTSWAGDAAVERNRGVLDLMAGGLKEEPVLLSEAFAAAADQSFEA